jgi:transposase
MELGTPERRQVFDLPEDIHLEVTEHVGHSLECPNCGQLNPPQFPDEAKTSVQYGPRIKGKAVCLAEHQHVAMNRVVEILMDFFNAPLSTGSVVSFIREAAEQATPAMELVEDAIAASVNAHLDETGCRQGKRAKWLHAAATECLVALRFHESRGHEAIEEFDILPRLKGLATHDFWRPYLSDTFKDVLHNFCRAHLMRELEAIAMGYEGQSWAARLKKFLSSAKRSTDAARDAGRLKLAPKTLAALESEYRRIVKSGLQANRLAPPDLKRGNIGERTTPKNLLRRLVEYENGVLLFIRDLRAPFDNNEAERVIRVAKIKMKVSGCFRSVWGAKAFATLRGYIATARKNGVGAYQALLAAFHGTPFIPDVALPIRP